MFVELIDLLRCVRPHEDSWLVAAATRTVDRHIVDGALGCPICTAEYAIRDGVVEFGASTAPPHARPRHADDVVRLAALLGLSTPGGTIALGGAWQPLAAPLAALTSVRVLLVDPPLAEPLRADVSAVRGGDTLPIAASSVRGVALDASTASAERLASAVSALVPDGRLVAPASVALPDGVVELARDADEWVAKRTAGPAASRPIPLRRAEPRER